MDDWYNLTYENVAKNGGRGLIFYYNNSPSKALCRIYPEHHWEVERFKHKKRGLRESQENQIL